MAVGIKAAFGTISREINVPEQSFSNIQFKH